MLLVSLLKPRPAQGKTNSCIGLAKDPRKFRDEPSALDRGMNWATFIYAICGSESIKVLSDAGSSIYIVVTVGTLLGGSHCSMPGIRPETRFGFVGRVDLKIASQLRHILCAG